MPSQPPTPSWETRPRQHASSSDNKFPGVRFSPGQWPTPELALHPIGRYSVCTTTSSYTSETLQSALDALGPCSTLYLPASSVWTINAAIQLHEHQELASWGYPTEEKEMARLEAAKDCRPHIVNARAKTGARLRNVVVDGGRERYGPDPQAAVMLQ